MCLNIADFLNQSTPLSEEQLEEILNSPRETVVDAVLGSIAYPNLNALIAAYHAPHESYEAQLLDYSEEEMQEEHAIYWMLTLGKMGSKKAFDRIAAYTDTGLFHQAFVSLAMIDIKKALPLLEKFIDKHCILYQSDCTPAPEADSGFDTLVTILDMDERAKELVYEFDLQSDFLKKKLVKDALAYKV
jgi:hypothetical protein